MILVADAVFGERLREGDLQEDLAQITFVQAFEHHNVLKDLEKVRPWLWATTHNLAMNHVKRRGTSRSADGSSLPFARSRVSSAITYGRCNPR